MLMSLNMPLEPGKRRGRRVGGAKKKKLYDMYITKDFFVFFLGPPPPSPHPTSRRIPNISITHALGTQSPSPSRPAS